jgi:hypothetical protein
MDANPHSCPPGERYILQYGEYPGCLANRFNVHPDDLLSYNNLADGDIYQAGLILYIPPNARPFPYEREWMPHPAKYTVESGNNFFIIACMFGDVRPEDIAILNKYPSPYMKGTNFTEDGLELSIP